MKKIDPAIVAEIRELVAGGANRQEVADAYGVSLVTMHRYCAGLGPNARRRAERNEDAPAVPAEETPVSEPIEAVSEPPRTPVKVCRECGQELAPGARFCHMCGTQVKSERELLMDRIVKAMGAFSLLPERARDTCMETMRDVLSFLDGIED